MPCTDRRHWNQQQMVRQHCVAVHRGLRRRSRHPRKCEKLLGCTVEQLVRRIGFDPNMQLDHVIPLAASLGGESLEALHHHSNLQMLTPQANRAKSMSSSGRMHAAVALIQLRYGRPGEIASFPGDTLGSPTSSSLKVSACTHQRKTRSRRQAQLLPWME